MFSGDATRAVKIRRQVLGAQDKRVAEGIKTLPVDHFNYESVVGACCENVVG